MFVVVILAVLVMMAMRVMFCKADAVGMRMAVVFDRHNDIEAVRLWNFLQGLPKPFQHGERKKLALARLPPCFQLYQIGRRAGQAEPGRNAILVNGQLNEPVASIDALQLWAVDVGIVGRVTGRERKIVAVTVAMPMPMPMLMSLSGWSMEVSPRSYGDPAAERD